MRSILEQAVLHHLNGEDDRASELFHQFIVSRARQIHESMRNGDETLVEGWEETVSEEYFGGDQLAELEDDNDAGMGDEEGEEVDFDAEAGDEIEADLGSEDDGLGDDDLDMDDGIGGEEGEVTRDEIEELRAELEALTAEFKDMKADAGMEDEEMGDEIQDDMGEEGDVAELGGDMGDDEDEDAPFQAMGESITSELDKVEVSLKSDGQEIAAGGSFAQQRKSPIPAKKGADRMAGKPVQINAKEHKHFNREPAPSVAPMKPRRNTMAKSSQTLTPVKK
jgi:hypothetical protein